MYRAFLSLLLGTAAMLVLLFQWRRVLRSRRHDRDGPNCTAAPRERASIEAPVRPPDLVAKAARDITRGFELLNVLVGLFLVGVVLVGAVFDRLTRYIVLATVAVMLAISAVWILLSRRKR